MDIEKNSITMLLQRVLKRFKWLYQKIKGIIIPLFSIIGGIAIIVSLVLSINSLNIQWSHYYFDSDYQIQKETIRLNNQKYNENQILNDICYNINDTFEITFRLDNRWKQPLDTEFDILKNNVIVTNYSCTLGEECTKKPYLNREFYFRRLEYTEYINVKGVFNNSNIANVVMIVSEPGFEKNKQHSEIVFNPCGIKNS